MGGAFGRIGGSFVPHPVPAQENGFLASLIRPGDDLRHMMSGRCGIMLAIRDFMRGDDRRVAYLPAYTCETVSGCFYRLGYRVTYYDVDRALRPLHDERALGEISLALFCGYYGFKTFDEPFIRACAERGIGTILDATHSLFTADGVSEWAQYVAGSVRKVLPVACGGVAIKRGGRFGVESEPIHEEHVRRRYAYFEGLANAGDEAALDRAAERFWDSELMLREVYGAQESDERSVEVVNRYPVREMIKRRAENYNALFEAFPEAQWAAPALGPAAEGVCPTHFPVYSPRRDQLIARLREAGVHATVYWPMPPFIEGEIERYPGADWIYRHILALPVDQRYGPDDMRRVADAVRGAFGR